MHRSVPALVLGLAVAGVCLSAQTPAQTPAAPPTATGAIIGTVVDEVSGKPIAGATVSSSPQDIPPALLISTLRNAPMALTGPDGRFMFTGLAPALYAVTASRNGYLNATVGNARGGIGTLVNVAEAQIRTDVTIAMARTASISGTVLDEAGEPVIGAAVMAARRTTSRGRVAWSSPTGSSSTDDRGIYRVSGLAPGDYVVLVNQTVANMPSSMVDAYQQAQGKTRPGQANPLSDEMFAVGMYGSTPGMSGARAVGTQVQALSRATLQSGADGKGRNSVYPTQFYPAAFSLSKATVVTLKSSDERVGIDIALAPVPAISVSGTVMGPDGPAGFTAVTLAPKDEIQVFQGVGRVTTATDATGAFTMLTVPSGDYILRVTRTPAVPSSNNMVMTTITNADGSVTSMGSSSGPAKLAPLPPDPTLWAEMPFSAGAKDITNFIVSLKQGAHLSGRVEFSGSIAPPTPEQLSSVNLSLQLVGGSIALGRMPRTRIDERGELTSQGFPSGQYFASASGAPAGWTLRAITSHGVDVTQNPLDIGGSDISDVVITFTDKPTELSGTVGDRAGAPPKSAAIYVFPSDEPIARAAGMNPRRVQTARSADNGHYRFRNLPPGDYRVVAIDDVATLSEYTAEFIQKLSARATSVRLGEGEKREQHLTVVTVK